MMIYILIPTFVNSLPVTRSAPFKPLLSNLTLQGAQW